MKTATDELLDLLYSRHLLTSKLINWSAYCTSHDREEYFEQEKQYELALQDFIKKYCEY